MIQKPSDSGNEGIRVRHNADAPEFAVHKISLITTCMGRLSFLKQTLPNWIATTSFPIVVVDYSCPERTGNWIERSGFESRVSVVRQTAELRNGLPEFNTSKARNAGAAAVKEGYLLFLDADTLLSPEFENWLLSKIDPGSICLVPLHHDTMELGGALATHTSSFMAVRGFDERIQGWGSEDIDLKIRLRLLGLNCKEIPRNCLKAIHHSNALRVENHAQKDLNTTAVLNAAYLNAKYRRLTGKSYASWSKDPAMNDIFFMEEPTAPDLTENHKETEAIPNFNGETHEQR